MVKRLKTSLIYITDIGIKRAREAEALSLLLSLTLSKIYLTISKYATIFKSQFVWDDGVYATELGLVTKKKEPSRTFIYHSRHFQPPTPFFNSNFASFLLLADYSSFKLTNEKTIKVVKDRKYFIFIQNLPDISFDLSHTAQIVEFLPND